MGVLGICNRTENWRTAKTFAAFFEDECACKRLARRLAPDEEFRGSASLELFSKGVRDYVFQEKTKREDALKEIARLYCALDETGNLRNEAENFHDENHPRHFSLSWDDRHYASHRQVSESAELKKRLYHNVYYTEFDIVLDTPKHLFIGEAKGDSDFDSVGKHLLVHQLIRQYITATLLVRFKGEEKKIVPFIVAIKRKLPSIRNSIQVKFMVSKGWLSDSNILSWDCVREIGSGES